MKVERSKYEQQAIQGRPVRGRLEPDADRGIIVMSSEPTPLVWPQHFPPSDWWGRFFAGVPPFGPSVAFFRRLERDQAARTEAIMSVWTEPREREVALKLGEGMRFLGWKTPYFIPSDQVMAVVGGPNFGAYVEQDLGYLLDELNRHLGRQLNLEFLWKAIDWKDAHVRFGELVESVAEELGSRALDIGLETELGRGK